MKEKAAARLPHSKKTIELQMATQGLPAGRQVAATTVESGSWAAALQKNSGL